ncbi:MAG: hypothetical protein AAGA48_24000 [Myxococcota bacterium]
MIVRRPFASTTDASIRRLSDLKDRLDHQNVVAASGITIQDVDDAAGLWRQIDNLSQSRVNLDAFLTNGEFAESILRVADVALQEGADVLSSARALAVYLSNDSFVPSDRSAQLPEVEQMIESIVQIGNAQYGKRFVFAGTAYDSAAFDEGGTYLGTNDVPSTQVSDTQFVNTGFDGSVAIESALAALQDFANALQSGDQAQVNAQIDVLDEAFRDLVLQRQQVGHEQSDVGRINDLTRSLQITVAESLDQLVGQDPIEALTSLSELQSAYQIALQVTATRSSNTIFDFLR